MQLFAGRLSGAFVFKWGVALALVVLGDVLFYPSYAGGGALGLYGLALLAALVVTRPAVRRDVRAWLALIMAATFAGALVWDASLLAVALFWTAAGMATLLPATARFDDG